MATLAEAVDAAETDWLVSADIPDAVDYLTVESEVVQVTATFPAQYQARDGSTSDPRIRVVRAAGGTTAASHADGTALTPLIPPSSGPGGAAEPGTVVVTPPLEVDVAAALEGANAPDGSNPLRTMADVPPLVEVLAVGNDAGAGPITGLLDPTDPQDAATKAYADAGGNLFVSPTNPGAVGAGGIWVDIDEDPVTWQRRNATNDGWDPPFLSMGADGTVMVQGDGTADLVLENDVATVTLSPDGTININNDTVTINPDFSVVINSSATFTGAGGLILPGLPTADPVAAGALWNDTGTVKVSAG